MGKPVDIDFVNWLTTTQLRYIAGRAYEPQGDTSLHTHGFVNPTFRQPYGVCGAITPWNAPVLIVAQKLAPAFITGNTLVVKISKKAPLSPLVLAKCCQEMGLPKGAVNILNGFGRPCGEAIARHMDIRKLSFTGSTATGKTIKKAAAESNLKNITVELGGKSWLIVFNDADLEKAAGASAFSFLANSGQACVASSRVFIQFTIADKFVEALKASLAGFGPSGDPLAGETKRGPQADQVQFRRVVGFLDEAKASGLEIVTGGEQEVFGLALCLNTFDDEEAVLKSANNTEFGLYASVFIRDISRVLRVAKRFEAGSVGVNCASLVVTLDMPFGGWKQSGEGKENSKYVTDHWTDLKSVYTAL
ncbi:aldehyde dehydrogenase [Fusarium solani]|uniref:aldehyde dehydrogenase (NAD(+)) n=1 Tax=Fusarium solani TaxID=169388 RepID=A0A9P9G168_FUSSL|nr:aldehyde dehydrogenase [Fusarium solani]KAH7230388.1 aldehyde dehydrogenase [Fusarium solani]